MTGGMPSVNDSQTANAAALNENKILKIENSNLRKAFRKLLETVNEERENQYTKSQYQEHENYVLRNNLRDKCNELCEYIIANEKEQVILKREREATIHIIKNLHLSVAVSEDESEVIASTCDIDLSEFRRRRTIVLDRQASLGGEATCDHQQALAEIVRQSKKKDEAASRKRTILTSVVTSFTAIAFWWGLKILRRRS